MLDWITMRHKKYSNVNGSYTCLCPQGYNASSGTCQGMCIHIFSIYIVSHYYSILHEDVNECLTESPCGIGNCSNNGSYICLCPGGYNVSSGTCQGIPLKSNQNDIALEAKLVLSLLVMGSRLKRVNVPPP